MALIDFASISFQEGYPFSTLYNDRYFLESQGLAESEYVYLLDKKIAELFNQEEHVTLAEIGFGVGLNFLATAELWIKTTNPSQTLIYISCERYPLSAADMKKSLTTWMNKIPFAKELLDAYQGLSPGLNTFVFIESKIILILLIGEALTELRRCSFQADHWMLDGFSPSKNESAWEEPLLKEISRLTASKATLATFTAAGFVRRGLKNLGWQMSRVKGFAQKRHRLIGTKIDKNEKYDQKNNQSILIAGSGISSVSFQYFRAFLNRHDLMIDTFVNKASNIPYVYSHPAFHSIFDAHTLLNLRAHLMSGHFYRQISKLTGIKCTTPPPIPFANDRKSRILSKWAQEESFKNIIKQENGFFYFPLGFCFNGFEMIDFMKQQSNKGMILLSSFLDFKNTIKNHQGLLMLGTSFLTNELLETPITIPTLLRGQMGARCSEKKIEWLFPTTERYDFQSQPRQYEYHQEPDTTFYYSDLVGFRSTQPSHSPFIGFINSKTYISCYHGSRGFSTALFAGLILSLKSLGLFSYDTQSEINHLFS